MRALTVVVAAAAVVALAGIAQAQAGEARQRVASSGGVTTGHPLKSPEPNIPKKKCNKNGECAKGLICCRVDGLEGYAGRCMRAADCTTCYPAAECNGRSKSR